MVEEAFTLRRQLIIDSMQDLDKGAGQGAADHWHKFTTCAITYGAFLFRSSSLEKGMAAFEDAMQASRVRKFPTQRMSLNTSNS